MGVIVLQQCLATRYIKTMLALCLATTCTGGNGGGHYSCLFLPRMPILYWRSWCRLPPHLPPPAGPIAAMQLTMKATRTVTARLYLRSPCGLHRHQQILYHQCRHHHQRQRHHCLTVARSPQPTPASCTAVWSQSLRVLAYQSASTSRTVAVGRSPFSQSTALSLVQDRTIGLLSTTWTTVDTREA